MTTNVDQERPKRVEGDRFIVEQLANELMIYDQKRNKAFCLNHTAASVWQHCNGTYTIPELAAKLKATLPAPIDEKIVKFALETLSSDGLLEPSTFHTAFGAAMTRRDLMQKFGLTAAMSLPLVTGLLVATPKAHASSQRSAPPPPPPLPIPIPKHK